MFATKPSSENTTALSLHKFLTVASELILKKDHEIKLVLCSLLARGHCLIEDIPGMGKTTLVKIVSQLWGLQFSRIQFTNDLLPSDILGSSVYNPDHKSFHFHKGPIFAQLVLGDELNRGTPRTQSAFMQVLEEKRVTIDGVTHLMPNPFFFIATQNPRTQIGTFPLPESQLDRFLMRIRMGYPDKESEAQLIRGGMREKIEGHLDAVLSPSDLIELQGRADHIHMSDHIVNYIQDILAATRSRTSLNGLSPRTGIHLAQASRAWALIQNRAMVLPEDVKSIAASVINHRLLPTDQVHRDPFAVAQELIESIPIR